MFTDPKYASKYWATGIHTKLTFDPNLADITYQTAPIAPDTDNTNGTNYDGSPYSGTFDGNGHTINNLTIDTAGEDNCYLGFFGYIDDSTAEIKNLAIVNCNITGGSFSYCVGGLAGINYSDNITNCYSTGIIDGHCYVGGLIGASDGRVMNSYSTATISGDISIGGLMGWNLAGTITNSYSTGTTDGVISVGGLVGVNDGGSVTNCYSIGSATGAINVGGLVGENNLGSITNCFWDTVTSDTTIHIGYDSGTTTNVVGLATTDMQKKSTGVFI